MPAEHHRLGPGRLALGETGTPTDFSAQSINTKLSPEVNEEDAVAVLSGEEIDGDDTINWKLSGTLNQTYERAGLIHWCFTNALKKVPFEFIPNSEESDYGWRGTVKVVPLEVGGDVKKKNTTEYEFKVIGSPETFDLD